MKGIAGLKAVGGGVGDVLRLQTVMAFGVERKTLSSSAFDKFCRVVVQCVCRAHSRASRVPLPQKSAPLHSLCTGLGLVLVTFRAPTDPQFFFEIIRHVCYDACQRGQLSQLVYTCKQKRKSSVSHHLNKFRL